MQANHDPGTSLKGALWLIVDLVSCRLQHSLTIACLILGIGLSNSAQSQSVAWADLPVPQGVVSHAVRSQGKLVSYDEGSSLHIFSAVTRQWHSTTKSPSATLRLFNDCIAIIEPNLIRAFSSYTGQFQDLITAGSRTIHNASNNKNDSLILVSTSGNAHSFSAFTGAWSARSVTPSFAVEVQRHVAIIRDGATLSALGAFDNTWHDQTCGSSPMSIHADGTAAVATSSTSAFAFSAHTSAWATAAISSNSLFHRGDDWSMWLATGSAVAFSSLQGTFATTLQGATTMAASTDLYALLNTPTGLCAYSAITGDFLVIDNLPLTIETGSAAAILRNSKSIRGYSPLRQQIGTLQARIAQSDVANIVAFASDINGQTYAWSSLTAEWHQSPATTIGSTPALTETTVALESATDCYAFAARSGQFIALGNPVNGLASNPTSAPLLSYNATSLFAFDADSDRWLESPRTSSAPPTFNIWRTSALVIDGSTAHGFGAQNGSWQQHTLASSSITPRANSEVAYVIQPTQIAACSMLPEIVCYQQFPHFRRIQPRSGTVSFVAAPPTNSVAIAAIAPLVQPVLVPGLGALMLDSSIAFIAPIVPTPSDPAPIVRLNLAADLVLAGETLASQLLILPANGPAYLGNRATVQLW